MPIQLETTQLHGEDETTAIAQRSVAGVLEIINGFILARDNGRMDALASIADRVYASGAQVFQSQEFVTSENLGPSSFLYVLEFLYSELGQGQEALQPLQVCHIYAHRPDPDNPNTVEWLMTTHTVVPGYGPMLVTAAMTAENMTDGWRVTYHDYADDPAPGEDCSGARAATVHQEWLCRVEPNGDNC
ncbi:MAG: hypothetical protein AAGC55_04185 [Myxococcota bacterium]